MIGLNAKTYRNTATYEAPTWSEITLISDLTINPTWDKGDASSRESRIKQSVKTLLGLEITGKIKKKLGNANYNAFMDAMLSDDVLDLLVLDGDKDTVGVRGWRADFQVFSSNEDQALGSVLFPEFSLEPSITDHPPKAVLVAAGPTLTYSVPGVDGATFE